LTAALARSWGSRASIIRYGIIITGYSNIIASMYGGIFGARGLMPNPESSIHDLVVFLRFHALLRPEAAATAACIITVDP
jgi:hypothetical protein